MSRCEQDSAGSDIPEESNGGAESGSTSRKILMFTKGTIPASIFILLTTIVGAGSLSLPYALSKGGIVIFSVVLFLNLVSL